MCGILGQSTNNPKKISQGNIRILGVHNESRGKNSCGITIDGEIFYGLDREKLFSDFMKGRKFDAKVFPIVFGHTRQSSVGTVNEYNAHPFGFGENLRGDGYKFIGVHNGTLHNYKELAEKYDISITAPYVNSTGVTVERDKIDSEILLEILSKSSKDDYSVLSEYQGRAALVWTDTDYPNTIYLWSGKSRPSSYATQNLASEERPLNVYIESKNNFYFSSTPESLELIGGSKEEIFQIDYNTVYVVRNGDFAHARKIQVSRDDVWHESWGGNYRGGGFRNSGTNTAGSTGTNSKVSKEYHFPSDLNNPDFICSSVDEYMNKQSRLPIIHTATPHQAFGTASKLNIYDDKTLKDKSVYDAAYRVYHEKFRYWKKGNLINGVWIYDSVVGFVYIAEYEKHALRMIKEYEDIKYVDGGFDVNKKNSNPGRIIITKDNLQPKLYYFIDGALLKDTLDYSVLKDRKIRQGTSYKEDYIMMSHMVEHPLIDISVDRKPDDSQLIYKDGVLFTGVGYSIGWEKRYNVREGNILFAQAITSALHITPSSDKKYITEAYNSEVFNKTQNYIENFERSYEWAERNKHLTEKSSKDLEFEEEFNQQLAEEEVKMKEQSDDEFYAGEFSNIVKSTDEVNDIIEEIANKHLTKCLIAFQECTSQAKDWKEHPSAKELIRCCDSMESILSEYITAK